jgi:hypothetical protein
MFRRVEGSIRFLLFPDSERFSKYNSDREPTSHWQEVSGDFREKRLTPQLIVV